MLKQFLIQATIIGTKLMQCDAMCSIVSTVLYRQAI